MQYKSFFYRDSLPVLLGRGHPLNPDNFYTLKKYRQAHGTVLLRNIHLHKDGISGGTNCLCSAISKGGFIANKKREEEARIIYRCEMHEFRTVEVYISGRHSQLGLF